MSMSVEPSGPDTASTSVGRVPLRIGPHLFKRAQTASELEQVHRLNHATFVREIHEHPDPGTGRLVDKFHHKNIYFVAMRDDQVVGMISVHDQPPFSIADRLDDPGVLDGLGERPLEVRLLAVSPDERHKLVFAGLLWSAYAHARRSGYTHMLISGIVEHRAIYRRLGFRALGPPVRTGKASFVPMVLPLSALPSSIERDIARWKDRLRRGEPPGRPVVSLLPGPVEISPAVRDAHARSPISHRGREFLVEFARARRILSELASGMETLLLGGSGTLANEAVAATIAADPGCRHGLVLVNGEFGERLARQGRRWGLRFREIAWAWGRPWDLDEVADALRARPAPDWIWAVHLETSTGVLNDLSGLRAIAAKHGVRLCLDCVSSIGAVPLDLEGVSLATAVSGKSLGAYPGIAIVLAAPEAFRGIPQGRLPEYLDLSAALGEDGPRFTFPSPPLAALNEALGAYETAPGRRATFARHAGLGRHVRATLRSLGLVPLAPESVAAPCVTTFAAPRGLTSTGFVALCREWGFEISGLSRYLCKRGWVQIASMGAVTGRHCEPLFQRLAEWLEGPDPA